jgi:hypothetical protein
VTQHQVVPIIPDTGVSAQIASHPPSALPHLAELAILELTPRWSGRPITRTNPLALSGGGPVALTPLATSSASSSMTSEAFLLRIQWLAPADY